MSGAVVWASDAMVNVRMLRPITYGFPGKDYEESVDIGLPSSRRNRVGESLAAEHFPAEIYVKRDAKTNYEKLDDLFFAGSYWVVSGKVADIMHQFDLGGCHLYPTKVFRKDRKTPIGDRWYCLNFGNVKKVYLGGGRDPTPHIKTDELWHYPPSVFEHDQLMLAEDALVGPDIWVDPRINDTFFVSDRLEKALKAGGVARPFGFKRCRIGNFGDA